MRKSNAGFTLVELIVSIAAGAMVLAIALTFFLLGMRIEKRSYENAGQQNSIRIVLTFTEKLAKDGKIRKIDRFGDSWAIYDSQDADPNTAVPLLQYRPADGSLLTHNSVLMSGLKSSLATLDSKNRLFTLTCETEYGSYKTTIYCRSGEISTSGVEETTIITPIMNTATSKGGLMDFLKTLCNQYGSEGKILGRADGEPEYFSEWYIKQQDPSYIFTDSSAWNKDTPWCACFVSWGAAQTFGDTDITQTMYYFANVDVGMSQFKTNNKWKNKNVAPDLGDITFFSWDGDDNPEHVGVVVHKDEKNIYTIEGNSGGKVNVNKYPLGSDDIVGYGVLDW